MRSIAFFAVAALALLVDSASADFVALEITEPVFNGAPGPATPIAGDTYSISAGIGGAGGFALSQLGIVDSVINNGTELNGTDLFGETVFSSDNTLDNGGGNFDVVLTISGGDLAPDGFTVGGLPATTAALFVGGSLFGDSVDLSPHVVNFATVEIFDGVGESLGLVDVSDFAVFDGPDGWTGDLGVGFGVDSVGIGISSFVLRVNITAIPEPASALVLATLGVGLCVRRRR